jgi:molybdenum cofactor guanylyltransferase
MGQSGVCGVVLAGGAGRRVGGRDKGWIMVDGRALIEIALERLRAQVDCVAVSANRELGRYSSVCDTVLRDAVPGFSGPLAGIARALDWCPEPWLATVPVDTPNAPPDWIARLRAGGGEAAALVLHDGERRQPLFALYRRELAAKAHVMLGAGRRAVYEFQDAVQAREIALGYRREAFLNLNRLAPC